MHLVSKAAWTGIVFILLTTAISGRRPTPLALGASLGKEVPVPSVANRKDVKKMQQTLRGKGYYRGKIDGVFGLRTRAGVREFQKAENLPVTGQLDAQTEGKFKVRSREKIGYETTKGKPSACIKRAKGPWQTSNTLRGAVKTVVAPEAAGADRERTLQVENDNYPQSF